MNAIANEGLIFEVISELYKAGVTEDGEDYIAEVYVLRAEAPNGQRWEFSTRFPGAQLVEDETEEGYAYDWFADIREEASARAEALLATVKDVNADGWGEVDGRYGSTYHVEPHSREEIARHGGYGW